MIKVISDDSKYREFFSDNLIEKNNNTEQKKTVVFLNEKDILPKYSVEKSIITYRGLNTWGKK